MLSRAQCPMLTSEKYFAPAGTAAIVETVANDNTNEVIFEIFFISCVNPFLNLGKLENSR